MPKPSEYSSHLNQLSGSVFTKFKKELAALQGEIFPFHIGDTYFEPAVHISDVQSIDYPEMHYYTKPQGYPPLLKKLSTKYECPEDRIVVSAGATGGLHVLAGATLEPEEEVLVLAPYWPLIAGIIRCARANPVEVPFFGKQWDTEEMIVAYVESFLTEKTVALYINSPNNPTSLILNDSQINALIKVARKHNLWIWSDEVYADLTYEATHAPIQSLAPERTFAVHSFSKGYGMTGNRCGFVLCPSSDIRMALEKVTTYAYYSVPTAAQIAACMVLDSAEEWLERAKTAYIQAAKMIALELDIPVAQGGTFVFVDVSRTLANKNWTMDDFLRLCLQHNILLAPGESFGKGYENYIRLCFTAAPEEKVHRGLQILKQLL